VENESSGQTADVAAQRATVSAELEARVEEDRSSRAAAFAFLASSIFWLLIGSFAGLIASEKLTQPDFLTGSAWLTFGRIRIRRREPSLAIALRHGQAGQNFKRNTGPAGARRVIEQF
jgi:hypothetical protein